MTVLIIDDDTTICELALRYGVATHAAQRLDDGLQLAHQLRPDVILLDTRFAGDWRTGYDVIEDLRDTGARVCLLSAVQTDEDRARAIRLGAYLAAEKTTLRDLRLVAELAQIKRPAS